MLHKTLRLLPLLSLPLLASCASDIGALAADKATACVHQTVSAPGWSENITVIRANSDNTSTISETSGGCNVAHNGALAQKPAAAQ